MISIFSLIYKSTKYIDALYDSIRRHTPALQDGSAEFFFVANDATDRVKSHLVEKNIPHYILDNDYVPLQQMQAKGFAHPEYMRRVYRGYNFGTERCRGDIVVPINSDHLFAPGWLENLVKHVSEMTVPSSLLVEPGHPDHGLFPEACPGDFGRSPESFQEEAFIQHVSGISAPETRPGGAYMPSAFTKEMLLRAGGWPEGNLAVPPNNQYRSIMQAGNPYGIAYADKVLFYNLKQLGVDHITALDSIVYHIKEGEKDE